MRASAPFFRSIWERRDKLAQTPLQIVWGGADSALTPDMLNRLKGAWPHASVVEMPTVGHWPHEEAPAETVAAVREFLAR